MTNANTFQQFIRRIREGDSQAATDLIRQYERVIRLEVRVRLRDRRLCRIFDSMDICQSVLASFFVRAAAGQYELDQPDQLLRLLVVMTRNKVANQAKRQQAQRRDHRRVASLGTDDLLGAADQATPSRIAAGKELLDAVRARLNGEERQLVELRSHGYEWAEIARQMGGTPEARRKQLARVLDRVSQELNLDEVCHA